jgi:hypothetical protein
MLNIKKPILDPCLIVGTFFNFITSKDGLLWKNGKYIPLPEADIVARKHGFVYAEQLVKHLVKQKRRIKYENNKHKTTH